MTETAFVIPKGVNSLALPEDPGYDTTTGFIHTRTGEQFAEIIAMLANIGASDYIVRGGQMLQLRKLHEQIRDDAAGQALGRIGRWGVFHESPDERYSILGPDSMVLDHGVSTARMLTNLFSHEYHLNNVDDPKVWLPISILAALTRGIPAAYMGDRIAYGKSNAYSMAEQLTYVMSLERLFGSDDNFAIATDQPKAQLYKHAIPLINKSSLSQIADGELDESIEIFENMVSNTDLPTATPSQELRKLVRSIRHLVHEPTVEVVDIANIHALCKKLASFDAVKNAWNNDPEQEINRALAVDVMTAHIPTYIAEAGRFKFVDDLLRVNHELISRIFEEKPFVMTVIVEGSKVGPGDNDLVPRHIAKQIGNFYSVGDQWRSYVERREQIPTTDSTDRQWPAWPGVASRLAYED